jgi:hypothetical protein
MTLKHLTCTIMAFIRDPADNQAAIKSDLIQADGLYIVLV